MGYASYIDEKGRRGGYAEQGVCDYPGCGAITHRGVGNRCGAAGCRFDGCGDYFCDDHIYLNGLCHECDKTLCQECREQYGDDLVNGLCEACQLLEDAE